MSDDSTACLAPRSSSTAEPDEPFPSLSAVAVLSLLHEPHHSSATRLLHGVPVLAHTLNRLAAAALSHTAVLCWDDQLDAIRPLTSASHTLHSVGPRRSIPALDALTAACRWSDSWRGGPLQTTAFDQGFHGPTIIEALSRTDADANNTNADAVLLVSPAAALIEPAVIDDLIAHLAAHQHIDFAFTPTTPGTGAIVLRRPLLDRLARTNNYPGKLLNYSPDRPSRDPLVHDTCLPTPAVLRRSHTRLLADSDRQLRRLSLPQPPRLDAAQLLQQLDSLPHPHPRDLTLELTTRRATSPLYSVSTVSEVRRPDAAFSHLSALLHDLASIDDIRLTIAGVGDPLLYPRLFDLLDLAADLHLHAVHVETDFLPEDPALIDRLAAAKLDVVTVHLPALTASTYAAVMDVDRLPQVLENTKRFLLARSRAGRGVPLLVPLFVKCRSNFAEMEAWFDQWLRALGTAVIRGPSTFCGLLDDVAVADMSPPRRPPCRRIRSRLTVLSDGTFVTCEQDVLARQPIGHITSTTLSQAWRQLDAFRTAHAAGDFSQPLCSACTEAHRP